MPVMIEIPGMYQPISIIWGRYYESIAWKKDFGMMSCTQTLAALGPDPVSNPTTI